MEKSSVAPLIAGNIPKTTAIGSQHCEPVVKALKSGKQYTCTQCTYSADKKVSLNRHMRMHQASPLANSTAISNNGNSSSNLTDDSSSQVS